MQRVILLRAELSGAAAGVDTPFHGAFALVQRIMIAHCSPDIGFTLLFFSYLTTIYILIIF